MLVHRFVNNCTNHVGCGFECAGPQPGLRMLAAVMRVPKARNN